jgi:hypothetical protein
MTEQEQRELAERLADGAQILNFERALEAVRFRPAEAEEIIRMREEHARSRKERARALERLRRARIEEFG